MSKSKPKTQQSTYPHAMFFEHATSIPQVCKGLLRKYMPKKILDQIDFNRISTEKTTFISKSLKKNISDCLIKAHIKDEELFVIQLLEHQSSNDPLMPFRVLEYMIAIWRNYLKQNKGTTKLPVIYPILISNAKDCHNMPTSLDELFDYRDIAKQIINFEYKLVDLLRTPEENFNQDIWSDFLELALKYNRELPLHETIIKLKEKIQFFSKTHQGTDYISSFMCYNIYETDEKLDEITDVLKQILGDKGDNVMGATARKLIDEGIQIGESRGIQIGESRGIQIGEYNKAIKTAKVLLFENIPILTISKCTGLSIQEVDNIKMGLEK
jgi:predicted transposase/invertase (TIGR01784 family)